MSAQIVFPEFLAAKPDTSSHVEARLLMTNNNAADTPAADNISDLTLDEMDGANYAPLVGYLNLEVDAGNRRAQWRPTLIDMATTVSLLTWTALGAGTRSVKGLLWALDSTHPTHPGMPIAYRDLVTATAANGEDFKLTIGKILETSGS